MSVLWVNIKFLKILKLLLSDKVMLLLILTLKLSSEIDFSEV